MTAIGRAYEPEGLATSLFSTSGPGSVSPAGRGARPCGARVTRSPGFVASRPCCMWRALRAS